jgi:hypothetical protein
MKGYLVPGGYMGFIDGRYQHFETEDEYVACYREQS